MISDPQSTHPSMGAPVPAIRALERGTDDDPVEVVPYRGETRNPSRYGIGSSCCS